MSNKRRPWEDIDGPVGPPEAEDAHIQVDVSDWAQRVMETTARAGARGTP